MANLDEFLNPQEPMNPNEPIPVQRQEPPMPQQQDPERERLRLEMDELRAELTRMRAMQQQPVQPATPPEDPWQAHVRMALREANISANEFVESPMETFVKATAASMQKARQLWNADVVALNSSMRLDAKFEDRYPDLYESDFKKMAVQNVLIELKGDSKFQRLLGASETIPQALDVLAAATYKKLGVTNPRGGGEPGEPQQQGRKGTYGMPGGARLQGPPVKEDSQQGEVSGMIKYLQGGGSRNP